MKKRIYRAAVSQRLRNADLDVFFDNDRVILNWKNFLVNLSLYENLFLMEDEGLGPEIKVAFQKH
jgi:hypothetical protein